MSKPRGKVHIAWTPAFAYAIGLLVSDGNLSPDGRHIVFTSKDEELVHHYMTALNIEGHHVGKKQEVVTRKNAIFLYNSVM